MNPTSIVLKKGGFLPHRHHDNDAGYDLFINEDAWIFPNSIMDVHTGVFLALPDGVWCQLMPRSSTLRWYGLEIVPAVLDPGYRGEVFVQTRNIRDCVVRIERGVRIAQLIPHLRVNLEFHVTDLLPDSTRGDGGFGSTGF